MSPSRQPRNPLGACLALLVPTLLAALALPAAAAAAPAVSGALARTAPTGLRAAIVNTGDQPLQRLQMQLLQPGAISGLTVVKAPPGTNCDTRGADVVGCQFQPDPATPAGQPFPPGQDLVIDFTTAQPYPDNAGASAFVCPFPCPPGQDAGPFLVAGPQPPTAPPPAAKPGRVLAPGFDLFETDPTRTQFHFEGLATIGPNVICPGCGGFSGRVHFGGIPLETFGGFDSGDADTIVRRGAGSIPDDGTSSAPIGIELVALSLVSIEPISVQTAGGAQLFDVFVDVSGARPSTGAMVVRGNSSGGRFDSVLEVVPTFTFRRVDDGRQTGVLDTGQFPRQLLGGSLLLRQANGVWRRGCASPAQRIKGVNDVFCPGQTPRRVKRLTIEQAALARHGVYPVQPRLEHFACYQVTARSVRSRRVRLRDQFGRATQRIGRHRELCNPARKNAERWTNRKAHLQCYDLRRRTKSRLVAVRNQFGSQRLRTNRTRTLCVPSRKYVRKVPRAVRLTDHFQCYDLRRAPFKARRARLRDQFGTARVTVVRPIRLCNPVRKNNEASAHPVRHLVCYSLRSPNVRRRNVHVRNQFGRKQRVKVIRRTQLCVPSLKLRVS